MSRAFVKESDGDAADDLPERAESGHPNYLTEQSFAELERRLEEALAERDRLSRASNEFAVRAPLARLSRDIRYLQRRIDDAIVMGKAEPGDEVAIGTSVTIDDGARQMTFTIVGEDQADPASGLISWMSPLGRVLVGAKRGESVVWERPVGDITVTVVDVHA